MSASGSVSLPPGSGSRLQSRPRRPLPHSTCTHPTQQPTSPSYCGYRSASTLRFRTAGPWGVSPHPSCPSGAALDPELRSSSWYHSFFSGMQVQVDARFNAQIIAPPMFPQTRVAVVLRDTCTRLVPRHWDRGWCVSQVIERWGQEVQEVGRSDGRVESGADTRKWRVGWASNVIRRPAGKPS
jgi:hypothetical protein